MIECSHARFIRFYGFSFQLAMVIFLVTGCAQELPPNEVPALEKNVAVDHVTREHRIHASTYLKNYDSSKISQCTRELEALKSFNNVKYNNYKLELGKIKQTSASYLGVANGISEDINDLVRPKLQYALTNLCYRIKNDLSESLIKQVNIHD